MAGRLNQNAGVIRTGAFADVVVLNLDDPLFAGVAVDNMLDAWITGGSAAQIAAVYVGGERRVEHGEITLPAAAARYGAVARALHSRAMQRLGDRTPES
jgi:cytosine/adenosine deaminase-related metal-dependent hydrolase